MKMKGKTENEKVNDIQNELDKYLEDDVEDDHAKFNILNWWKLKAFKYYILYCMARDILVIPVYTISYLSLHLV